MPKFLFILILCISSSIYGQDVGSILKEAQQLETGLHENEAFLKYVEVVKLQPNNITALCACSELCSRIGNRQSEKTKKIDYFKAAKTYAQAALRVNAANSDANFVMALAMGRASLIASGKEKVALVREIKWYADNAIRANPSNFKAYHLLGKWNYEVANLNSFERTMAKWLYGALPPASMQSAIYYYEKSRSLNPTFILNYLELAKVYNKLDDRKKAIDLLTKMLTLPEAMIDDVHVKQEGRALLKELQ